jgi:hypothetical protein
LRVNPQFRLARRINVVYAVKHTLGLFAWCTYALAAHAAICNPQDFRGSYGFLLTGTTTIGNGPKPTAAVGRLVLDGSGKLGGITSADLSGLLLGNPVTGTYEAHTDCSVTWSLQDDSGDYEHFQGTLSSDGRHVSFRQTDPGGAQDGTMMRASEDCSVNSLRGRYHLSVAGNRIDVDTGRVSGIVSISGVIDADSAGGLSFSSDPAIPPAPAGTYESVDGCFVHLTLRTPAEMHFRGVVGERGAELVGIQIDPGAAVSLHMTPP